eukprot:CAMPEP_0183472008 /NCGR_PEP_ID=MMETSP0370-20130417/158798_1 /TAXON_ID=268820 /ORGANISM="Peridinium aciculiferum, Strain PAER-2" /LENGTH=30 /DNA_ID= /DNA_START= /DNA_END= /DNA_ORIENTATION=
MKAIFSRARANPVTTWSSHSVASPGAAGGG